jgi:hypothetical protein
MRKLTMAAVATIVAGGLPFAAAADDAPGRHHHRHHVRTYAPYVDADPAVRGGYVMNGNFDWRRIRPGEKLPWYAHGYNDDCVAWTPHAYHYACDPNNRY